MNPLCEEDFQFKGFIHQKSTLPKSPAHLQVPSARSPSEGWAETGAGHPWRRSVQRRMPTERGVTFDTPGG